MVDENGACVKSHSLGIRIQKKILGKMASRSVARHFIDDDAGKILDALYAFLKVRYRTRANQILIIRSEITQIGNMACWKNREIGIIDINYNIYKL